MRPTFPRETLIALRARHEAYRIASDILYEEPIDVSVLYCEGCGCELNWRSGLIVDPITCGQCGAHTPFPPHLRSYLPPLADPYWSEPAEDLRDDGTLRYEPLLTWAKQQVDRSIPLWLWWFAVGMLCLLIFGAFIAYRFAAI